MQKPYRGRKRAWAQLTCRVLFLAFAAVFLVSSVLLASRLYREKKEHQAFAQLAQLAASSEPGTTDARPAGEADAPDGEEDPSAGQQVDYARLYEFNPDFFGWLTIEGTVLNYPVMYQPEKEGYYLKHAFDGSSSLSGVPYVDEACFPGCRNYLIHGHNMKNGTIFATLLSYKEESFWRTHPTITFHTLDGPGTYEIMGAFTSRVYTSADEGVFRYYQYTDLTDPDVFAEYVAQVKKSARYDTGVTAEYGDELITLSTCGYHTQDGRFVVVARKTN